MKSLKDLLLLSIIVIPRARNTPTSEKMGIGIDNDVNYLVVKATETVLVLLVIKWFFVFLKSSGCLDNYKLVDNRRQLFQPNFEEIKLIKESEAIVNHKFVKGLRVAIIALTLYIHGCDKSNRRLAC